MVVTMLFHIGYINMKKPAEKYSYVRGAAAAPETRLTHADSQIERAHGDESDISLIRTPDVTYLVYFKLC